MTALQAVRREIADCKRTLTRLQRAEEILTGKRGIAAAPADKPPKAPSRPKQERKAGGNGRLKPGQLAEQVAAFFADGKAHTIPELATALGRADDPTPLYAPVHRLEGVKRMRQPGNRPDTFRQMQRETVIRPGEEPREGRIKGTPIG